MTHSTNKTSQFVRLILFSYETSLLVTRTFTYYNILSNYNYSIIDFLETNKHEIYHLWINDTKCCQGNCALIRQRVLRKDQFEKLYIMPNSATPGHYIKHCQHCSCGLAVNPSCSLDILDISMIIPLIIKCCALQSDEQMWLETIREIRNKISHVESVSIFDEGRLQKWWDKLEGSVMGLANKTSVPGVKEDLQNRILFLKSSTKFDFDMVKHVMDQVKEDNAKLQDITVEENVMTREMIIRNQNEQTDMLKDMLQYVIKTLEKSQPPDEHDDSDTEAYHTPPQSDSEPEQSRTIEVTGISDDVTKETVMYYFESREGGKCDVTEIVYVHKRKMYLITFEHEEGVSNAIRKSHKIGSSDISVKEHIPPKTYPNKVLISNIPENVSDDLLCNFMEAKTKCNVQRIEFSEEELDKAIVTFAENIDLAVIQTACKNHPLQKSYLTARLVPVSDCILVRDFGDFTTRTTLDWYFDNPRRSGVEGVKECKMYAEEGYCLIHFENAETAVKAADRKHTVEKCALRVNVYHECLGVCVFDNERSTQFKSPQPVIIKDLPPEKMEFLLISESAKHDLDKALFNLYCKIDWEASKEQIKVISTVTKESRNWATVVKHWQTVVNETIHHFIDSIVKEELSILQDMWEQVMGKVREIFLFYFDKVTLKEEKSDCKLIIVGYKGPAQEVVQNIKVISDIVLRDLKMERQQIRKDIRVKHYQALILEHTKFPENIKQKISDIDIEINAKDCIITLTGKDSSLREVKTKMYQEISDLVSGSIGEKSTDFIRFLDMQEVKRIVKRKMRDAKCIGGWDVYNNTVTMYSNTTNDLTKASDKFKDFIVEAVVKVEKNQKYLLQSQKWKQIKRSVENQYNHESSCTKIVVHKHGEIAILCTSAAELATIRDIVADFFFSHAEKEVMSHITRAELRFLNAYMKEDITRLENELRLNNISVAFKTDSIAVISNKDGIQEARNRVDALVKKIHKKTHSIDKPGLFELMRTTQGQHILKQTGKRQGVVICTDDELWDGGRGSRRVDFTTNEGRKVIVTTGDITALEVDVVVKQANKDLNHSEGLAKVLIERVGCSIQDECDHYVSKHGKLAEGTIFRSVPGTLKCKYIIHAFCQVWKGGTNLDKQSLSNCVAAALTEADLQHCNSIAIPALGTGNFGYPINVATKLITKCVRDHFKRNIHSSIRTVYLCDIKSATVDYFESASNKYLGQSNGESTPQIPSSGGNRQQRLKAASGFQPIKPSRKDQAHHIVTKHSCKVDFTTYAYDNHAADQCINLLNKMVEDVYIERSVKGEIISEFQNDQLIEIKTRLMDDCKVEVTINSKAGEIKIKGLMYHVSDAISKANDFIKEAEEVKHRKRKAKLVNDMVQWYYIENDNDKREYPDEVNMILESAFKDQQKIVYFFDVNGNKYVANFDDYLEYPVDDPTDKVQIFRMFKLIDKAFILPYTWDSMEESENLKIVQLNPTDITFIDVAQKFNATIGSANFDIVSIDRIQNKTLYIQYNIKKMMMDDTNPKTVQNERELWHGFSEDAQKSICTHGFNRRYCGKNGIPYGAGVYFAVKAQFSALDNFSRPDRQGHKRVFLSRVLTGEFCNGQSGTWGPPLKPGASGSHICYDSVTNDVGDPIMFIIFHDNQAYPEYMITFMRKC